MSIAVPLEYEVKTGMLVARDCTLEQLRNFLVEATAPDKFGVLARIDSERENEGWQELDRR